jgi:hypothetical protein
LFGCSESSAPTSTIPLITGSKQITDSVINELQANSEWYRIINQTTLEIEYPPKQYIIDFTNSEINKLVPKERARAFPDQLHTYVLDELSKNNIKYNLVKFDNSLWVVWEADDTQAVENIIDSYAIKALNEQ